MVGTYHMKQLNLEEIKQILHKISKLDITLDDIGFPLDNPFRKELASKINNLHDLMEALPPKKVVKKLKLKDVVVNPTTCSLTWYDIKSKKDMLVRDMHTYHILNAKRIMLKQSGIKAEIYVKVFNAVLFARHENLPNLDGAPNLLERRV